MAKKKPELLGKPEKGRRVGCCDSYVLCLKSFIISKKEW
jgi:hypothetical protein